MTTLVKRAFVLIILFFCQFSLHSWNLSSENMREKIEHLPAWAKDGIERDFLYFQEGFSKSDIFHCIDHLKQMQGIESAGLSLISITQNEILHEPLFPLSFKQNSCSGRFLSALNALNAIFPLPPVSFLITFDPSFDRPLLVKETSVPIFAVSKEKRNHKVILIPRLWNSQRERLIQLFSDWEKKTDKALFRGYTTDGPYGYYDWDFRPRARLTLRSRFHRGLIDAALIASSSLSAYVKNWMTEMKLMTTFMPVQEQVFYKYLIAMDGASSPSSLEWQLFSGSVVLKSLSNRIEWFYGGISSDLHYLSFRPDSEDLVEKILWLKSHDDSAKSIAENAIAFAMEHLLDDDAFAYLYRILNAYALLYSP